MVTTVPVGSQAIAAGAAVGVIGDWYATAAAKGVSSEVGKLMVSTWVSLMFHRLSLLLIVLGMWLTALYMLAVRGHSGGNGA